MKNGVMVQASGPPIHPYPPPIHFFPSGSQKHSLWGDGQIRLSMSVSHTFGSVFEAVVEDIILNKFGYTMTFTFRGSGIFCHL